MLYDLKGRHGDRDNRFQKCSLRSLNFCDRALRDFRVHARCVTMCFYFFVIFQKSDQNYKNYENYADRKFRKIRKFAKI